MSPWSPTDNDLPPHRRQFARRVQRSFRWFFFVWGLGSVVVGLLAWLSISAMFGPVGGAPAGLLAFFAFALLAEPVLHLLEASIDLVRRHPEPEDP